MKTMVKVLWISIVQISMTMKGDSEYVEQLTQNGVEDLEIAILSLFAYENLERDEYYSPFTKAATEFIAYQEQYATIYPANDNTTTERVHEYLVNRFGETTYKTAYEEAVNYYDGFDEWMTGQFHEFFTIDGVANSSMKS